MKRLLHISLSLILVLLLSLTVLPISASAAGDFKGSGQENDPYLIESLSDLIHLRDHVNNGYNYNGTYFLQTVDLDLISVENWDPIGNGVGGTYFGGIYNGGGHTVSNVTVYDAHFAGLFGCISGTVMNLGIESGSISGVCAGGLVSGSTTSSARLINCYSLANVSGLRAGGIADYFVGCPIVDCWSAGVLAATEVSGGIVSYGVKSLLNCSYYGDALLAPLDEEGEYLAIVNNCFVGTMGDADLEALRAGFRHRAGINRTPVEQLFSGTVTGKGTKEDPYVIKSAEALKRLSLLVNGGISFSDTFFRQGADIDLSSVGEWTPIGIANKGNYFYGVYDGDGHVIRNVRITEGTHVGLFGTLAGKVMNLGIESGRIEGECAAGIAGNGTGTRPVIVNCFNNAEIVGLYRASGIVDSFSSGLVVNCLNTGKLSAPEATGGIAAYSVKRMINCFSVGSDVGSPILTGAVEASCAQVTSADRAVARLNEGLYEAALRTNCTENNLLLWDSYGGFRNEHQSFRTEFFLRGLLIALILFSLLLLFFLTWKTFRRANRFRLSAIGETVSEGFRGFFGSLDRRLYVILCFGFTLCFGMMAVAYLNGDRSVTGSLGWPDPYDAFMDFFNPLYTVMNNNYEVVGHYTDIGGTYPPLARGLLWLLGRFLPAETMYLSAKSLRGSTGGLLLFLLFFMLCCIALLISYRHLMGKKSWFLPVCAVFCAPMLFLFDRGNLLIAVLPLCAFYVAGYRSKNPLIRHLAYVCLALSAALKIYPAVLGLLVLREKNWKHTLQCVVYGVTACILPFFFIGGIPELLLYVRNVTTSFGKNGTGVRNWLLNYSNTLASIGDLFGGSGADVGRLVAKYTLYPFTLLLVICGILCRHRWKAVLAGMLVIILFPGFTVYYCAAFLAIPLFCLIAEPDKRPIDHVYAVLMLLSLAPWQFLCGAVGVEQGQVWFFSALTVLLLALVFLVDCLVSACRAIARRLNPTDTPKKKATVQ